MSKGWTPTLLNKTKLLRRTCKTQQATSYEEDFISTAWWINLIRQGLSLRNYNTKKPELYNLLLMKLALIRRRAGDMRAKLTYKNGIP
jgi:hypothetical protein